MEGSVKARVGGVGKFADRERVDTARSERKRLAQTAKSPVIRGSVRRGNLKRSLIVLKYKIKIRFDIGLEYLLEYRVAGFELRIPWRTFWLVSWFLPVERYSSIGEVYASVSLHPHQALNDLSAFKAMRLS